MSDGISYEDVKEHHYLFTLAPAFILKMMAGTNSNLVSKFKSTVQYYMDGLTDEQKSKLDIILSSDIDDLQIIMDESYRKTKKEQYKILADPKNKEFIKKNLDELRKMI
ncbi:hypothetical protein [Methanobrevibacter sp.]|uniref:hypothetical protein n=1 Tax=Methanobrevibacter sp. TaxID=66852 RepID=UPI00388FF260